MRCSVLLIALLVAFPIRPDPVLTPGHVATTSAVAVCTPGYATAHRNVSDATKRAIYRAYGIVPTGHFVPAAPPSGRRWQSDFEVDHLVSLQLGGSNEPANLWPESYATEPLNARHKDDLENRLHWLVCHGRLRLADAQRMIRDDWIAAYRALMK